MGRLMKPKFEPAPSYVFNVFGWLAEAARG
jgi:hypothetical protein